MSLLQQFSGTLDRFGTLPLAPAFHVKVWQRIFLLEVTNKYAAALIFVLIYTHTQKWHQHCLPPKLLAFVNVVYPVSHVVA